MNIYCTKLDFNACAGIFFGYFLHCCFYCVGICVLEEQLISQDEDERPSKRGRSDNAVVSTDTLSWIELARYACLQCSSICRATICQILTRDIFEVIILYYTCIS